MRASTDFLGRKCRAFDVLATWQCPNGDNGDVIDPAELGDEDAYWKALGVDEKSLGSELGEDGEDQMEDGLTKRQRQAAACRDALIRIVCLFVYRNNNRSYNTLF